MTEGRRPNLIEIGSWESLVEGTDLALLAVGAMTGPCLTAAENLAEDGLSAAVINCRFAKPLDTQMLEDLAQRVPLLITVEESALTGGFGSCVSQHLAGKKIAVRNLGLADRFYPHGLRKELLAEAGLSPQSIACASSEALESLAKGWGPGLSRNPRQLQG